MLALEKMLSEMRLRIGNPGVDDVSDRALQPFLESAVRWIATELELPILTRSDILWGSAGVYEYPLPQDVAEILWLRYGTVYLDKTTVYNWVRAGIDYRSATSGTPKECATEGRLLYLYPPPSSTHVSSYPTMTVSYIGRTEEARAGDGYAWLPPSGEDTVIYQAAAEYLISNATGQDAMIRIGRANALRQEAMIRLAPIRERAMHTLRNALDRPSYFTRWGNIGR